MSNTYSITVTPTPDYNVSVEPAAQYNVSVSPIATVPASLLISKQLAVDLATDNPIGGQRVLALDLDGIVVYADKDNEDHVNSVIGISKFAVSSGELITVKSGEMVDSSWSWTPGFPIFLGNNGLLTQTIPTSGFLKQIAIALTETKIDVTLFPPIRLQE